MGWIRKRLAEPSSAAGLGLIYNAVVGLLANPQDPQAIGSLVLGVIAVVKAERAQ